MEIYFLMAIIGLIGYGSCSHSLALKPTAQKVLDLEIEKKIQFMRRIDYWAKLIRTLPLKSVIEQVRQSSDGGAHEKNVFIIDMCQRKLIAHPDSICQNDRDVSDAIDQLLIHARSNPYGVFVKYKNACGKSCEKGKISFAQEVQGRDNRWYVIALGDCAQEIEYATQHNN